MYIKWTFYNIIKKNPKLYNVFRDNTVKNCVRNGEYKKIPLRLITLISNKIKTKVLFGSGAAPSHTKLGYICILSCTHNPKSSF